MKMKTFGALWGLSFSFLLLLVTERGHSANFNVIQGIPNLVNTFQINNTSPNAHLFNLTDLSANLTRYNLRVETTVVESRLSESEKECPLIFSVRQARSDKSWALPLQVHINSSTDVTLYEGSQTICVDTSPNSTKFNNEFLIVVSTCSSQNVTYKLNFVANVSDTSFILKIDEPLTNVDLSPSVTRFFRFDFEGSNDRVLVDIVSDDEICMTAAVQSPWCSLVNAASNSQFFQQDESEYKNVWEDMTNKAIIPVSRSDFPQGSFFLGFTVHSDASKCGKYKGVSSDSWTPLKTLPTDLSKLVRIKITEEISTHQYLIPLLYPLFYSIGLILLTAMVTLIFTYLGSIDDNIPPNTPEITSSRVVIEDHSILVLHDELRRESEIREREGQIVNPGSSSSDLVYSFQGDSFDSAAVVSISGDNESRRRRQGSSSGSFQECQLPNIPIDPSTSSTLTNIVTPSRENREDWSVVTSPTPNNCQWLTMDTFINRNDMYSKRAMGKTYLQIITVGIFYILPTFQLSYTYHQISNSMGQLDLCYRNFECSHKIWGWDDFNHIYSNIFYVMAGLIFCLFVRLYQLKVRRLKQARRESTGENFTQTGVVYEFGVFYGLGCSLIIEGVLSAAYHVCPSSVNFQFDTSFMYVLALLSSIKIFQFRHSCLICPHNTFGLLGVIVFFSVIGLLLGSKIFESFFFTFHFVATALLSIYMYYVGHIRDTDGNAITGYEMFNRTGLKNLIIKEPLSFLKPKHGVRLFYVIPFIVFNVGLNIWQLQSKNEFPMYLLYLFAGNMMLYFTHYFAMKIFHGEMFNRRSGQAFIYLMVSLVLSLWGILNFLDKRYSAQLSPAESRTLNKPCDWGKFYDSHDVWHFLSAGSIFFFFMTLLTIDDAILTKPRSEIVEF